MWYWDAISKVTSSAIQWTMGQHHTMSSGSVPSSNNGKKLHYKAQALQEIKNSLTPFALVSKLSHKFYFKEVFDLLLSDSSVQKNRHFNSQVVIIFTLQINKQPLAQNFSAINFRNIFIRKWMEGILRFQFMRNWKQEFLHHSFWR